MSFHDDLPLSDLLAIHRQRVLLDARKDDVQLCDLDVTRLCPIMNLTRSGYAGWCVYGRYNSLFILLSDIFVFHWICH